MTSSAGPLIVGVGASAGGLEAFEDLLVAFGSTPGVAIVFVQHLDPNSKSLRHELLAKMTDMAVVQLVIGRKKLIANTLYVCPPQSLLELKNGFIHLSQPAGNERHANVIDHFFHSIAEEQGGRGIGIVLSGAGSDGTLGLKAISDRGGLTFAQDAKSAQYDSMPRSAATTGVADHVLPPSGIASELLQYVAHLGNLGELNSPKRLHDEIEEAIPAIAEVLFKATEHHFQHYKTNTLVRRVQRRMQVLKIGRSSDYVEYLTHHEDEAQALFRELLIGVTAFFRDPEAFETLKREVLPKLFDNRTSDDCVRIWVAGCANGAEAYTMAILCREVMNQLASSCSVQIFATDIDERALSIGRAGEYPVGIEEQISPERLQRFFVKRGKRYQVTKELRDLVLFSAHNLISDPPFSRQDLISCRNLLIYLGSHLQNKLIPLFHYSLRPSGYLLLGPSENIVSHGELFRPVDARLRISQRKDTVGAPMGMTFRSGTLARTKDEATPLESTDLTVMMQKIALDEFTPATAVIDESGHVRTASSKIDKYVHLSDGPLQTNIVKLVASGLRIGLRAAIADAKKTKRRVEHENLSVRIGDAIARAHSDLENLLRSTQIATIFLDDELRIRSFTPAILEIYDLIPTDVGRPLERLIVSNAIDITDRQRADAEARRSEELVRTIAENSTEAMVMMDDCGYVTYCNQVLLDMTGYTAEEIRSAPLHDLIHHHYPDGRPYPMAECPIDRALPEDFSVRAHEDLFFRKDGSTFDVQCAASPIFKDGKPISTVIEVRDVTQQKAAARDLLQSKQRLELAMTAGRLGAWEWDIVTDEVIWSPQLYDLFGYTPETFDGTQSGFINVVHPDDRERVGQAIQSSLASDSVAYEIDFRVIRGDDGTIVWTHGLGTIERDSDGKPVRIVGVSNDDTVRKQSELELADRESHLRRVIDNMLGFVGVLDTDGTLLEVNQTALTAGDVSRDDVIGQKFWDCFWWNYDPAVIERLRDSVERALTGETVRYDVDIRGVGDSRLTIDFMLVPVHDNDGNITHLIPSGVDISERHSAEQALRQTEQNLRIGMQVAQFGIGSIDYIQDTISLSKEAATLYGLGNQPICVSRLDLHKLFHADDRAELEDAIENCVKGNSNGMMAVTHRIILPDGGVRWLDVRKQVFVDRSIDPPTPTHGVLAARDMTEQIDWARNLEFINEVQNDFNPLTSAHDLLRLVPQRLYRFLNLCRCTLVDFDEDQLEVEVVHDLCEPGLRVAEGRYLATDIITEKHLAQLIANRPVVINDTQDGCLPAEEAAQMAAFGCRSLVNIPYLDDGRLFATLTVAKSTPYVWQRSEIDLLTDFTSRLVLRLARARGEEELTLAQSRLALAIQSARMGAFEWEPDTDIAHWDKQLSDVIGVDDDAPKTGKTFLGLVYPDDVASLMAATPKVADMQSEYRAEFRIIRPDGQLCWLAASGVLMPQRNGHPARLVGLNWDITEQKEAVERIRQGEERLRLAMNAAQLSLWEWDVVKDEILWAKELYDHQAMEQSVKIGGLEDFLSLVHDDDRDSVRAAIKLCLSDGKPYDTEFRMRRADGTYRWVLSMAHLSVGGNDEPVRMVGVEMDTTERKQAELDIRLGAERLSVAADAAGFGMLHVDLKTETVTYSPELNRIVGWNEDQADSLKPGELLEFVHPDDRELCVQHFKNAMMTHSSTSQSIDHRIVCTNAKVRWVRLQTKTLFSENTNEPTQIVGTLLDITRQRQFEEDLKTARDAAEAANQSKSAFVANMSHEIRTPMTAILGYADLIRDMIENPEAKSHLQTIRRNGAYLLEIINDILDLSKIEAGKLDIEMERFQPARLIEDVRSVMEVRATEGGLKLEVEYDGELPKVIESDAKRLKQILINLVGNAIKFTKVGHVKIRVRFAAPAVDPVKNPKLGGSLTTSTTTKASRLHFDIIDTGIGMSDVQQERLFKPFSQGDAGVTRDFGGTGLGLAISQRLAEMLGGEITASSTEGVGSTFMVTIATGSLKDIELVNYATELATELAEQPTHAEPTTTEALLLGCHVLVVDDRRDIRFLTKRLLTKAGATVDECEDGQFAVDYITDCLNEPTCPALILLDMQMPNMDGYEAAQALRQLGYTGPIIALTADAMQGDMNECIEAGCNDYLSKPIDAKRLVDLVAKLTRSKPLQSRGTRRNRS